MEQQPRAGFGYCPWRERTGGGVGWWADRVPASERLCDYITVIMQRLNSRAASFEVCREIAFVYKRHWAHILFVLRKEQETQRCVCDIHRHTERAVRGWELNRWLGQKKGMIRNPPPGWRCQIVNSVHKLCWDVILQCDQREEKRSESNSSCNAKGVKNPTRTTRIDRCNRTHNKAGKRHALSNFLHKMHKFCEMKGNNFISLPTEKHMKRPSSSLKTRSHQLLKFQMWIRSQGEIQQGWILTTLTSSKPSHLCWILRKQRARKPKMEEDFTFI